ncbi:sec-independent protein translocase protein TatB [Fontimonas thermophila]|uniref:Sec-independent protein translocase protein TatB n=1 Tax=Fontimonas thermophila TaxID=1076937 RepID=A0A1I2H727_9GAMM|nr:Sec-independent protein translocase protein TatB [Fontimonas thermophila]SFF24787.1 sec-independent protein translocase protein TatB [Fontimonas thermophila]
MFDIGFSELLLCFVIALIVLGPEKLPGVARTLGRWTGQARGYLRHLTAELDREARLAELKRQLEDANRLLRDQGQAVQDAVQRTIADVGTQPPRPGTGDPRSDDR